MPKRPVWAEISRSQLLKNYDLLRELAGSAELLAVVKANAYGHGVVECTHALTARDAGVSTPWLGVTCVEEGAAVRGASPTARVLVMGGVWEREAEAAIAQRLTPVVWEPAHIDWVETAAQDVGIDALPVHLEIDTGMSRQGARLDGLLPLLERIRAAKRLRVEGVLTHLHSPEARESQSSMEQLTRLAITLDQMTAHGFHPQWIHAGNSATLMVEDEVCALSKMAGRFGARAMLRPGLALYGYAPRFTGIDVPDAVSALQPVLEWKTRVVSLRSIEPGDTAGYSATFRAQRKTRLALLPVGYADGLNRLLSNRGSVLVRGHQAPIVGRISMDLTTVDVTDVPGVTLGDEAVLIGEQHGEQGEERITAYDHADMIGTIPYEVLCNINARVPRVMVD
jgi:alanine racemase